MFLYLVPNRASSPLIKTPLPTLCWRRRTASMVDDPKDTMFRDYMPDQSGLTLGLQVQDLQRREEPAAV
jgi:hypothetical protein